jgi:two-component system, OmpR family, sensor histidine kinase BaeS
MTPETPTANRRAGFATRLLIAQSLVLVAGASTSWLVAAAVGPGIFSDHLHQAGLSHTAAETRHVEEAFGSAMVVSLVVALVVALAVALGVTWFFTHRVQRSINAVTETAAQIADGGYRTRVLAPGLGPEFDLLASTINRLADRLEDVEQTRRRMLSDLAHEMRTPLATIEAHLEAIEDGVREADSATLSVLKASTDRLDRLAHDIGAVSRAEEGQLDIVLQPVRADAIVEAAVEAAGVNAERRGVRLTALVGTHTEEVLVDPERMSQVMGNLLDNALRHSPDGSTVTVSSRRTDSGWIELSVVDAGEGIAAEHIGHVFDRFYRGDTARNRAQGGSGIGLTITKALVEAHEGHLTVTSPGPGQGTTFTVHLPSAR